MDYKEMLIATINRIDDNKLLESLFYIVQKIIGKGF